MKKGKPTTTADDDIVTPTGPAVEFNVLLCKLGVVFILAVLALVTVAQCRWSYLSPDATRECAKCVARVLQETRTPHWLNGGSLLGRVRYGAFVVWDAELDVAMIATDAAVARLAKSVMSECDLLALRGEGTRKVTLGSGPTRVVLEAFTEDHSGSEELHGPSTDLQPQGQTLRRSDVYPLAACSVDGVPFQCPHNQTALLAAEFGPKWETAPMSELF